MPECRVCHKVFDEAQPQCPRCGFRETHVIGDLTRAEHINDNKAIPYRARFLDNFDFGVLIYHWKDENGSVVLARTERLSFGSGGSLLDETVWLQQQFARIPDTAQMELNVEILRDGKVHRVFPVTVPVPRGHYLQQVGITLSRNMTLQLLLKNPQEQTQSVPVLFLGD